MRVPLAAMTTALQKLKFMKFYILCLVILFNFSSYSQKFDQYCNSRFDFCIEYPKSFDGQPEPESNDELIFLSSDKNTEIQAFGSLAVEDFDKLKQEFKTATSGINITYKKITIDWFVFSGIDKKGKIVYRKTIKRKIDYFNQGNKYVFQTLMITYPPSEQNLYESYCTKILRSL
jgi:hypothetical protein